MKTRVLIAVIACAILGTAASGYSVCKMVLDRPEVAREAGITEDQLERLADLYVSTEKEIIRYRAEADAKKVELWRIMKSENSDLNEIREIVKEMEQSRSEVIMARLERQVRMKEILDVEQLEKVREGMRERVREHRGGRARSPRLRHRRRTY